MDTLTHALSGALLARATEPDAATQRVPRRTRMAVCFWAAAFPDSDFVLRFIDPLIYLTTHRGVTHSILMLPLWAVGLALLFQLLYRGRYSWRSFVALCALGIGIHIAGDIITSFGTMIFAPWSTWRAQLSTTFIIDPYFTSIIVGGLLASLYWRHTRTPAVVGLGLLAGYIGVQALLQQRALEIGERYAATHDFQAARVHALPQPFSPFHWLVVVEQPQAYHLSYISLTRENPRTPPADAGLLRRVFDSYRPADSPEWRRIARYGESPADVATARALWESPVFARYRRFAMFPAVSAVEHSGGRACVEFSDLRFALEGRTPPFRYAACRAGMGRTWRLYAVGASDAGTRVLQAID